MALKSQRFASNSRLQAAAENNPPIAAFESDKPAVRLIQEALRDLNDPKIGRLPTSFASGNADGIYGGETVSAVKTFQRGHNLKDDGVCGHFTLHALDAKFLAGPPETRPKPVVQPPPTEEQFRHFLLHRRNTNVVSTIVGLSSNLAVFGENHNLDPPKVLFFFQLVRALPHGGAGVFHASERFGPDARDPIAAYTRAPFPERLKLLPTLKGDVRTYAPVLDVAAEFPNHDCAVLTAGSTVSGVGSKGADARHGEIFKEFNNSIRKRGETNLAKVNPATSRGNFLLGAFHATRHHPKGRSTKTTTELLSLAGWRVHVIRLVVDLSETVVTPRGVTKLIDTDLLLPLGTTSVQPFSLLDLLRAVSGGRRFYADIRGLDSPFARVKEQGGVDRPYNELFDAVVFLP